MGSVESSKVIFYISTSKQDFRISDGREVVKINRQRNPFYAQLFERHRTSPFKAVRWGQHPHWVLALSENFWYNIIKIKKEIFLFK